MSKKYDYDVVIIGAGISGLVAGCYLAKAGMKTLIIEKNRNPGGYCTSFRRKGFTFDSCAHSIGGVGNDGIVTIVLKELDIDKRLTFKKYDPLDIIYTPDYKISFWSDLDRTVDELQRNFPGDAENIQKLFDFINNVTGSQHIQLRKNTLKEMLDSYLQDEKLKSIFAFLAYGNLGLPPSRLSAFIAVKFYKQFILDGGYYPGDQIQDFPDALAERFQEYGGRLLTARKVKEINVENNTATGVVINNDETFNAKYVISNCDVTQTFLKLINKEEVGEKQKGVLKDLEPSISFFVLYLGVDDDLKMPWEAGTNFWYLSDYDLDNIYASSEKSMTEDIKWYMCRMMPTNNSILAFTNAPYGESSFWKQYKEGYRDKFIEKIQELVPGLSGHIMYKDGATPHTLYKWTLNYKGAAYGWAGTPSQFAIPGLSKRTTIANLYLTGHWTTLAPGVPGVVYLGRDVAKLIKKREDNLK
ncbi:MAG TPA: NAD(P)/FAD-dependent oxidoreductase [Nitrospirae bacterium]|nr:phytoene desaturase [bacterium BMS3Abin09]HDH49936.1 NAD(P)/FAD-dependent oxidoreductase [Nitrospirota bacterium]HDY70685.1 NAD(P)/FAD-dependent oxidoreductase [Nitrospirota bacterium]